MSKIKAVLRYATIGVLGVALLVGAAAHVTNNFGSSPILVADGPWEDPPDNA